MNKLRSPFLGLLVLTALYLAGAKLGLTLAFVAKQVTVVWPPTGIALCAVLLLGYRVWPAIALGAFVANLTNHTPALTSLGIASGNTLEALAGAYLLNRFVKLHPAIDRFRDIAGLVFLGAFASTAVSATIGVLSLCATGIQPWQQFGSLWRVWFVGDAMGVVIIAPVLLTLSSSESRSRIWKRGVPEFIVLMLVLAAFASFVFARPTGLGSSFSAPDYAIFPFLIWAALRFGTCGMSIAGVVTAAIAVSGTIQGRGPFTEGTTNENLISLELFLFVASLTGLIMAVTETRRGLAERASQQSEERYRSLVLASSQVVWTTNAAGDVAEDLPSWRAFTGQTKEETMKRGWAEKLHPDDVQRVGEIWAQSLATGSAHEVEFRLQAADGTYRDVFGRAVPVFERDGRLREWVGMLTDVTDKKQVEREMLAANRRKDEFLAMLAHELRNPLAPIRNAAHVLRIAYPTITHNQLEWARDIIDRQIGHLTRLVDDLLDVSRITQGKITLQKENIDLAFVVERAVETSRPVIDERGHQLTCSLPPAPLWVEGDATRLAQVVSNLLNNAAKYTEEAGQITLTAERFGDEITLRVRDTGMGIPADVLPHIFDLFTQADRSLARSQGGLGIGLTLVRNLIEMHGGKVQAFSAGPGKGSEFVVHLPSLTPQSLAAATTSAGEEPVRQTASLRVLVVDDNIDSAESLAVLLELGGHDVRRAHDGKGALETACAFTPNVILLDIGLPGMDGFEVAKRLREYPETRTSFVVAVTGYGQEQDRDRSKLAGFDRHLVKPVDLNVLEGLLRHCAKAIQ